MAEYRPNAFEPDDWRQTYGGRYQLDPNANGSYLTTGPRRSSKEAVADVLANAFGDGGIDATRRADQVMNAATGIGYMTPAAPISAALDVNQGLHSMIRGNTAQGVAQIAGAALPYAARAVRPAADIDQTMASLMSKMPGRPGIYDPRTLQHYGLAGQEGRKRAGNFKNYDPPPYAVFGAPPTANENVSDKLVRLPNADPQYIATDLANNYGLSVMRRGYPSEQDEQSRLLMNLLNGLSGTPGRPMGHRPYNIYFEPGKGTRRFEDGYGSESGLGIGRDATPDQIKAFLREHGIIN